VEVAVARGNAGFGNPQTLTVTQPRDATTAWPLRVVATADRYVVLWWDGVGGRDTVLYAVSDSAGRFGATRTLAATGPNGFLSAGVAPGGTVTAAWYAPYCPCLPVYPCPNCIPFYPQLAYAQLAPQATTFGPIRIIRSAINRGSVDRFTASSGPGGSALAWTESSEITGSFQISSAPSSMARQVTPALPPPDLGDAPGLVRTQQLEPVVRATPETVDTLALPGITKQIASDPILSLPGKGAAAVATWEVRETRGPDGPVTGGRVRAAVRRADGTYGPPVQLSAPGAVATQPVAAATNASVVVAWSTGRPGSYRLAYTVHIGRDAFAPPRALPGRSDTPVTLSSAPNAAVAAWTSRDPKNETNIELAILRS
jgi:hypothetical protein